MKYGERTQGSRKFASSGPWWRKEHENKPARLGRSASGTKRARPPREGHVHGPFLRFDKVKLLEERLDNPPHSHRPRYLVQLREDYEM